MDKFITEAIAKLPSPDGDAVQHLRHVAAAFEGTDDSEFAIMATYGAYGDRKTGLTWGDLREILERLS